MKTIEFRESVSCLLEHGVPVSGQFSPHDAYGYPHDDVAKLIGILFQPRIEGRPKIIMRATITLEIVPEPKDEEPTP